MRPAQPSRKPTFLWQAGLILLPVALMAGFGFWAILRERNAMDQEARQRAGELLQSLPAGFGRQAASRLTQFDGPKYEWYGFLFSTVDQRGIGNLLTPPPVGGLDILRKVFPDWPKDALPLTGFLLDTNGEVFGLHPTLPRPPDWLTTLSPAQYQAWCALAVAADARASTATLGNLAVTFTNTQPPEAALVWAKYIQLRAQLPASVAHPATNPSLRFAGFRSKYLNYQASQTNPTAQLLRFTSRHAEVLSDSGLPLTTLALAEALQRAPDGGSTADLWEGFTREIMNPTVLTPRLLDKASQLAAGDPALSQSISAMRVILADTMAQSEMAEALRQTGKLPLLTPTNLWLNALGQRWFCRLRFSDEPTNLIPENYRSEPNITTYPNPTARNCLWLDCYPQSIVARGFADALGDARISLPAYFSITLQLAGEPVPLPSNWDKSGGGHPAGDLLAEAHFQMEQPVPLLYTERHGEGQKEIQFDAMPSHPQFTLQIRLTDRTLLYARQRQLQYIFGTLIGVSAAAALLGFIAAYRAFRRQQELNDLKSNFVSSVSHELRAPIASVRLMAENLERGKIPAAEKQQEYYQFIVQECRRLSSLIENVLDFSRIEQGRKQYEMEPTDLATLVRTTVQLMEPCAVEKGVCLRLESPDQPAIASVEAHVDGRAIQQALVNLIDNAIKHSAAGQTVSVALVRRAAPPAPAVHISVTDQGPGIPAAEQEKIFERFYRRGSELRRETPGIGIGLSLVKHIMEAHGGRVTVHSEPGQGSRFTLEIPLHASPPVEKPKP